MITIVCGRCGDRIGQVGPSAVTGNPRPVWKIEKGWDWDDTHLGRGTLEYRDETYRRIRQLSHEVTGRQRPPEGFLVGREVDLPVVVRCPKCRTIRWVGPEVALTTIPAVGR
jgi:hypothetical protein